jgi:hypothetical protein
MTHAYFAIKIKCPGALLIDPIQICNMLRRGWNEPEWQEKTILKNSSLQGIAWEFIPGAHPLVARF